MNKQKNNKRKTFDANVSAKIILEKMNKQEILEKLRQKRNEMFPERCKLEFGCEVKFIDYSDKVQVIEEVRNDSMWCRFADSNNWFDRIDKINTWDCEILGQPLTITDILRMLGEKIYEIEVGENELWFRSGEDAELFELDLSKGDNIANQDTKMIEALGRLLLSKE